jgi:hypothetical protein
MRRIRAIAPLVAALAALSAPAVAGADYHQVIRDCADDGKLDGHYQHGDLRDAQGHIPADINEYTDCKDVIAAALRDDGAGSSGGPGSTGGGSASGGSAPSSDAGATTASGATGGSAADVAALKSDTARAQNGNPTVDAGGAAVSPVSSGIEHVAGVANALPASLVVAIAALAGLCAVGGAVAARRRWPALVRAPLRLFRR